MKSARKKYTLGFSLIELSIVLLIVGVLTSAAVVPLSSTIRQSRYKQTQAHLQAIRETLHGHVIHSGHLPCPLGPGDFDQVAKLQDKQCDIGLGGLPAVTLGVMGPRTATGALLDAWGREYRYAVSLSSHQTLGNSTAPDWLNAGEPASVGLGNLQATGLCTQRELIATQIVWVVFSAGENGKAVGVESENQDGDSVFALNAYSTNQQQPFDDQMVWASRSELVYWLLKANWLP